MSYFEFLGFGGVLAGFQDHNHGPLNRPVLRGHFHRGHPQKQRFKQQTGTPTSTVALIGRFPCWMDRFPTSMPPNLPYWGVSPFESSSFKCGRCCRGWSENSLSFSAANCSFVLLCKGRRSKTKQMEKSEEKLTKNVKIKLRKKLRKFPPTPPSTPTL